MNIDKTKKVSKPKDIFDDDFEVIYQEEHYTTLLRNEFGRGGKSGHNDYDGSDYDGYGDGSYDDYDDGGYDDYDDDYDDYDDAYDYDGYDDAYGYDGYDDAYDYDGYDDAYGYDGYDDVYDGGYGGRHRRRKGPNLVSPAAKTAKAGSRIVFRLINFLFRGASLILTAFIIYTLAVNFWKNHSAYGDIFHAFTQKNYILAAYAAVAAFLLLFELTAFLLILFTSRKNDRRGGFSDTGRGLFSFVFIYAGSYLSSYLYGLVPAAPAPLQGVQGALLVYGSLRSALMPLCAAGIISCIIRKFIFR